MKSPFKFLDAYDAADTAQFFGRDAEIETLYEKVFETLMVLVYGASGTGKTSLIQCGLRKKMADTDWLPILVRRKQHLVTSLLQSVRAAQKTPIPEAAPIRSQIRSLYLDHYKPVYLIFDQFEELFILGDKAEAEAFFHLLLDLLAPGLDCKILLVVREEYIAYLSDFEHIVPTLFDNRLRVEWMNAARIQAVIQGTLAYHKIAVEAEEEVLDTMIRRLRSHQREGIALTTIQLLLDRLWQAAREAQPDPEAPLVFRPELLRDLQLEDIMGDFLEDQLKIMARELGPNKSELPLTILYALVSDDGTKRSLDTGQIRELLPAELAVSGSDIDFCVKRFEEMRILRSLGDG